MQSEPSPILSLAIVSVAVILFAVLPILFFTVAQKLLAYPFKIGNRSFARMFWSGALSASVALAIPISFSLVPIAGTLLGIFISHAVGAYLQQALHGLRFGPALLYFILSVVLYLVIWFLFLFGLVAITGGIGNLLSLLDQYVDLEYYIETFKGLFNFPRSA